MRRWLSREGDTRNGPKEWTPKEHIGVGHMQRSREMKRSVGKGPTYKKAVNCVKGLLVLSLAGG